MKFTDEEIKLCKKIEKFYIKPIGYGDWIEYKNRIYFVLNYDYSQSIADLAVPPNQNHISDEIINSDFIIPLWTWQDAKEWLKEKDIFIDVFQNDYNWFSVKVFRVFDDGPEEGGKVFDGKTDLEATLKVILEILGKK